MRDSATGQVVFHNFYTYTQVHLKIVSGHSDNDFSNWIASTRARSRVGDLKSSRFICGAKLLPTNHNNFRFVTQMFFFRDNVTVDLNFSPGKYVNYFTTGSNILIKMWSKLISLILYSRYRSGKGHF